MKRRDVLWGIASIPVFTASEAATPKITVVITTWQVPFDQVVRAIKQFDDRQSAIDFINAESRKWWDENDGLGSIEAGIEAGEKDRLWETQAYEPIKELGYDHARYELWGGESGFHAMVDHETYAKCHDDHYAGKPLPGYLMGAYLAGHKPE
jgi:hypothetical protein